MFAVKTSIEDNEIIDTAHKSPMLAEVLTYKREPWSDNKYREKDASV